MEKKNKSMLIIVAFIAAIVFLWLFLRRNPAIAQAVQQAASDFGLPDLGLLPYIGPGDVDYGDNILGSYVPAQMPGVQTGQRGYTPCNFCLQSVTKVTTPAPVPIITPAPTQQQIMQYPAPRNYVRFTSVPSPARPPLPMQWGGTF